MMNSELHKILSIIIIGLVLLDIILLSLLFFIQVNQIFYLSILYFDLFVVIILIVQFLIQLKNAKDKTNYIKNNWFDLLGMVPEILIPGFATFLRYFRLIKILSLFRKNLSQLTEFFKKTHLELGIITVIFILIAAATIFYFFENGVNPNVNSIDDAMWYTLITITTIGFGDIYPQTIGGRIATVIIIFTGLGFISYLAASVTGWFLSETKKEEEKIRKESNKEFKELKTNINGLHTEIGDLKSLMSTKTGFTPENIVYTPQNIVSFIAHLVSPWQSKNILDPACGSGSFFWEINKLSNMQPIFKGIDIGPDIIKMAEENLNKYDINYELINADFLQVEMEEKFDLIVSQPSSVHLKDTLTVDGFKFLNNEFAYLFTSLRYLKDDGHLVLILPEQKSFFYSDYHSLMREYLLNNFSVEGIISLPNNTFYPEHTLKTCLFILKNSKQRNKIFFAKYSRDKAENIIDNFHKKKIEKNLENIWVDSNLLADHNVSWTYNYIMSLNRLKNKKENSKYPIKELNQIITFKEKINQIEDVLLFPKNPMEEIIFMSELEEKNLENYYPGIVTDNNVFPQYLKLYLNSISMKHERTLYAKGINKTLSKSGLKKLLIEVPDLEIQNHILMTYNLSKEKYEEIESSYNNFKLDILNYNDLLNKMKENKD